MMVNNTHTAQPALPTELNYLVIGHVTADLTPAGIRLGGTVSFSGLTAQALGLNVGIITAHAPDLDTTPIKSLWCHNKTSPFNTTFENISNGIHRTQYLYHRSEPLTKADVPQFNTEPDILHLGPMANEVDWEILHLFPNSLKCLTPQGWMRGTDADQKVIYHHWDLYETVLSQAAIAVISHDDVQREEDLIASMASLIPVFVVTENYRGARVYWHNDVHFFKAPEVEYVDDTGAGDIFASAFFYRYHCTQDPWEAGRFAVKLASNSVTRKNLQSIPTVEEIRNAKIELIG